MKILFLSDINNVHTKKWVSGLAKRGCHVLAYGLAAPKDDFYTGMKNVEIAYSEFTNQGGPSRLSKIKYVTAKNKVKRLYKDFQPDIVHAHYATSYGLLGSFLNHHPFAISVWGEDVFSFPKESKIKNFIFNRNIRKADAIFSTSIVMAKETRKYTEKEVVVIPFGVDLNHFKNLNDHGQRDSVNIGIVKTLEDKYGISYLINAFDILIKKYPDKKLKLTIVGAGSKEAELKDQVKSLRLENLVEFTGRIDHTKIPEAFNQMDIVVIPSVLDGESFGVAAVEASACEKPVVVSNVGGLPEVILDGETGLVVEPKDSKLLADKIEILIEDPKLREQMGKAGRNNVIAKYNWEDNLDLQIQQYQKLLNLN